MENKQIDAEILLSRIEIYKDKLSSTKTVSDTRFKSMAQALFGVKLIIADLLIDKK
ncbi:MAG: hypothetical protein ABIP68_09630 [Ferruginibacter sp.]